MHLLKLFLTVAAACAALDFVWLAVLMKQFYLQELGEIARREGGGLAPRWGAAVLVYILIPAGVVLFVRPALGETASLGRAALTGALFGAILYGVYDLTNLATLERWTVRLAAVDIIWGSVLCAALAVVMRAADSYFSR